VIFITPGYELLPFANVTFVTLPAESPTGYVSESCQRARTVTNLPFKAAASKPIQEFEEFG